MQVISLLIRLGGRKIVHRKAMTRTAWSVVVVFACYVVLSHMATAAESENNAFPNLIVNPGFEDEMEGWKRGFGTAGVVHDIDASIRKSGSASLRLFSDNPDHRGSVYQDVFDFEPGQPYEIKWSRKMENVAIPGSWGAFVRVSVFDENGLIGGSHYIGRLEDGTRSWETFQYTFDVHQDAIRIRVELFLDRATGTVWWDDVSLVRGKPAEPLQPVDDGETYGADANPTGNPIGGGTGYTAVLSGGDFTVSTAAELVAALMEAVAGEVVYVSPDTEMDLAGYENVLIPAYVTLAGNRGLDGAAGPLLFSDVMDTYPLFQMAEGARLTGIRLRGPDGSTQDSAYGEPNSLAVRTAGNKVEVDNNEIYNWSYGGVSVGHLDAHIHHNYIHHVQRTGLGYPVVVGGGTALIEANYFDWYRHSIASSGGIGSGYEARYNISGENATSFAFDMHGGRDFCPKRSRPCSETEKFMAGEWFHIHHNTFLNTRQRAIGIRGVPLQGGSIHSNWFHHTDTDDAVGMLTYMGNVDVYDNVYGPERLLVPRQLERVPLVFQCSGWCRLDNQRLPLVAVVDPLKISFVKPKPGDTAMRISGRLPIDVDVDVSPYMDVEEVNITIGDRLVYSSPVAPEDGELSIDTTSLDDGVYTLKLSVYDSRRGTVVTERLLRIANWWETVDGFAPPREVGWFGTVDLSKTVEESAGWTYVTAHADDFFGDDTLKMRSTDTSEYLVWEANHLREFKVVAYAQGAVASEQHVRESVVLEVGSGGDRWVPLSYAIEQQSSKNGWTQIKISGQLELGVESTQFKLSVKEGTPADALAFGEVTLRGYVD